MAEQKGELFLGFDISTQSCKALVVDSRLKVVYSSRVHFDSDLPHYKTADGTHRDSATGRATSPTLMWVEALELALERLQAQRCPFDQIVAVSGSGQQHGSVYWSQSGVDALSNLSPEAGSVADQLRTAGAFACLDSPIWMDTSTAASCQELTTLAGDALTVADWTGSTAQERFSVHHFRRFLAEKGLNSVAKLSLVSSLGASLLLGAVAPTDISDAAGMNLMDIRTKQWHPRLLEFLAPGEADRVKDLLGEPCDCWKRLGTVHDYWVRRFGFSNDCSVVAWSGDNPCAVVGNGLVEEGDIAISLGTSDTALSVIPAVPEQPLPFGHLFPHPTLEGQYWSMLCYTNGDVTRRGVRDRFFGGGESVAEGEVVDATAEAEAWKRFSQALREAPPGCSGHLGLYYAVDEITPAINAGTDLLASYEADGDLKEVDKFQTPDLHAKAVIEMRALAIRHHLGKLMPHLLDRPSVGTAAQLLVTGGAAVNTDILQVFADVFQRPVSCLENSEGAAFGAAIRAMHALRPEARADLVTKIRGLSSVRATPAPEAAPIYEKAVAMHARLEAEALMHRGRF